MNKKLIVMPFATGNKNIALIINLIDKSMFMSDSSRPVTCLIKLEEFRLSNSLKWGAFYTFQKFQYLLKDLLVVNCPIAEIIKSFTVKSKLSHLLTFKSLIKDSNSSSENETILFFRSRFLIALETRSSYSFLLSFFVKPKSDKDEIEISIESSPLNRVFTLSKKSIVSSLGLIRKMVSILIIFSQIYIQ